MTPERWQTIDELLSQAREYPVDQREDFFATRCADDPRLAEEVRSLLDQDNDETFLDRPVFSVHDQDPDIGRRVGAYELVQRLGQGGMGAVYLAVRQDDYQHRVAIKWVQRGLGSADVIRRFQNERQILADLEHPNIARLHDGGTTADGRLYFVMEYIDGEPIDRFCERHHLPIRERLRLFLQVCEAVQLSHQRLVIHRDIKPGNILIDKQAGVPKLLDFGIAKILEPDRIEALETSPGRQPLTLRYASPEQLRGEVVTTASDIYSLGVLLYLLLCGCHPQGPEDPGGASGELEMLRRLEEREPARPSTAVWGESPGALPAGAKTGNEPLGVGGWTDRKRWRRRLRGDLDAIVLKALRFEADQRYGSVVEFAADIRRHFDGQVVLARKGTWIYRVSRSLRRHRMAVALFLSSVIFGVVVSILGFKAWQQKQQVDDANRVLDAVAQVLKITVQSLGPKAPDPVRSGRILDNARPLLEVSLRESPSFWADIMKALADTNRELGRYDEAFEILSLRLRALEEENLESSEPERAEIFNNLSVISEERGDYESAEAYSNKALESHRRMGHGQRVEIVKVMNNLASILTRKGAFEAALVLYQEGLEIRRKHHGPKNPLVAESLRSLGNLHFLAGSFATAAESLEEAIEIRQGFYGRHHYAVASVLRKLAQVRQAQGRRAEAGELFDHALGIQKEWLGEHHPAVTRSELFYVDYLLDEDRIEPAVLTKAHGLLLEVRARLDDTRRDWDLAIADSLWGDWLRRTARLEEACPLLVGGYRELDQIRGSRAIYTRAAKERLRALVESAGPPLVTGDLEAAITLSCVFGN